MAQQARKLSWELNRPETSIQLTIHDRDAKFVDEFDRVLRSEGFKVVRTPYRRPKANAHCERVIETIRPAASQGSGPNLRRHRLNGLINEYGRAA